MDWYHQRAALCRDEEIREILEHDRDEEIEHAAMLPQWLRRNVSGRDHELSTYLFSKGPLTHMEGEATRD